MSKTSIWNWRGRRCALLLALLLGAAATMQAAQVAGTVRDAQGKPVVGATVTVVGTNVGVLTDVEGRYTLSVPDGATKLHFSLLGYARVEKRIDGEALDAVLAEEEKQIDEVVVTAMGITRSQKALGYATSTVRSEELTAAKPTSVMGALAGKVAGVNISTAGGTGTSQKVVVRGFSSFTANNPLYVVDGVPILNSYAGGSSSVTATTGQNNSSDFGSLAGDINPDDVEAVTVLKGASATALYGSQAANGVIIITTKRGSANDKLRVSYTSSVTASNVLRTPQLQSMFGEGWPLFDAMENGSWGPKLDGLERAWGAPLDGKGVYDDDGVARTKKFEFVENNIRDFYETGLEYNNSVTITGGNEHTGFALSYSNLTADGIVPTSADKYVRNTFSFRGNSKYKKLNATYNISYVRKDIDAVRGGQGNATSGGETTYQQLVQIPVDISLSRDLKDYKNPYNNVDNFFTPYAANPYWIIDNNTSTYADDHLSGRIELELEFLKGLSAVARLGGDFSNNHTYTRGGVAHLTAGSWGATGGQGDEEGYYGENYQTRSQINATGLLNADYKLGEDFHVTGIAGFDFSQTSRGYVDSYLAGLNVAEWYSLDNGTQLPTTISLPYATQRRIMSALAQGDVSFREWAFVSVSLRNDWSSTLPVNDNSFFYWGVNGSVIVTDAVEALKGNSTLSFLKVRGGWGQTGNDAPLYRTNSFFSPTKIGLGFGNLYLPINGVAGLTEYNTIPNMALRPEITTELEFGFDVRFLNNRVGLDFAWYNRDTKDQIISASVAPETGYSARTRNVGLINNSGVEIRLYGVPIKTRDFSWDASVTFAKNTSEVKELWDDVEEYSLMSAYDVTFKAIKGQPLGVFQVPKTRTDENGKTVVNASGYPLIVANEFTTLGTSSPDFTLGFSTRLTYKGISVSALFDWRKGGLMYSNTARMLDWNGNGTNTLFNERQPFLVPNSVKLVSEASGSTPAVYAENDIPLLRSSSVLSYWNYSSANKSMEGNVVIDKSFLKLRELAITYALPQKWFENIFVGGVEVSAIGRNLFMWTAPGNNYIDPETTNYGNDLDSELGEFMAAPSIRTFGGSIRITF
ncbi:MAG: SusC/RagA family TonB-linked outer membrane protein [Prevotellaceae bacterium]|jgi:TonB-linked SusC/RagA family outer membrane protein|nr:SusC/RagA family TonB-linked outer membrane protein [Prevotellaceae bacterium]